MHIPRFALIWSAQQLVFWPVSFSWIHQLRSMVFQKFVSVWIIRLVCRYLFMTLVHAICRLSTDSQWKLAITWYDVVWQDMTYMDLMKKFRCGHIGSHWVVPWDWRSMPVGHDPVLQYIIFSYNHTRAYLVISWCAAMHLVQYDEVTPTHIW